MNKKTDVHKKTILAKLSNDLKIFHSFAEICKKSESAGYIECLFDELNSIFQKETAFIYQRSLIRIPEFETQKIK